MIALVRADDRLLHGLVAVSWTSDVAPETILIANDAAAKDTFLSNTMKMAKPAGVKMGIKSIEGAVKALNNPINDGKKIFLGSRVSLTRRASSTSSTTNSIA